MIHLNSIWKVDTGISSDHIQPDVISKNVEGLPKKVVMSWIVTVALVLISAIGFAIFAESPCMLADSTECEEAEESMSYWQLMMSGVENIPLIGLVVYTFAFPCVCITLMYALRFTLVLCSPRNQTMVAVGLALIAISLGTAAFLVWGDVWNETKEGFIVANAWGMFALSICLAATLMMIACRRLVSKWQRPIPSWTISIAFTFFFIPLCFLITVLFPQAKWNVANGFIRSKDVKTNDGWSFGPEDYKFSIYTEVLVLYLTIFTTCLAMALAKEYRASRLILKRALRLRSFRTTLGSSIAVLVYLALNVGWTYRFSVDSTSGKTVTKCYDTDMCSKINAVAHVAANLANLQISLLTLPIGRTNVFGKIMGVSWEASIKWHRFTGYLFLLFSTIHGALWMVQWAMRSDFTGTPEYMKKDLTNPMIFLVQCVMLVVFGVLTLPFFRRRFYEWFFVSHHFYVVVFVTVVWHAGRLWQLLLPAIGLVVIDQAIRLYRCTRDVGQSKITVYGDKFVRLDVSDLQGKTIGFTTMQFAYINIPAISTTQWHPITIGSSPAEDRITFYIKSLGHWSSSLTKLGGESPLVHLDFGYGTPPVFNDFENITFVCGGVGFTACMGFMRSLIYEPELYPNVKRVQIILSMREKTVLRMAEDTLTLLMNNKNDVASTVQIFLTGQGPEEPEDELDEHIFSRTKFSSTEFDHEMKEEKPPQKPEFDFEMNEEKLPQKPEFDFEMNEEKLPQKPEFDFEMNEEKLPQKSEIQKVNDFDQNNWSIEQGRPNLENIIFGDLVLACGTQKLIESARIVADNKGAVFHKERFIF
ncbi:hypothetical protein SARC_12414 [Sphaeroforma arctica JP610]|uniref:FAD-binding FR-type domain-containing protein n=1 Tax=Sphaeroforma arctica JP610 TaxID=667725 RepID=A0A0L0FG86_9EUKA|nr:hypothetical protein SARC_12414 [Sphaeroforma arctica JP610]KNC75053.1 hypothetical protein SARC_12414 [Sphaeroforma arctica JP610]|eukprot:XP_014148955.1 hypothetical protein SARC_12414 [Sphaeroforma arctica JP610]